MKEIIEAILELNKFKQLCPETIKKLEDELRIIYEKERIENFGDCTEGDIY